MKSKTGGLWPLALVLTVAAGLTLAPAAGPGQSSDKSAAENQIVKVDDAIRVLDEMMKESDKSIPAGLIRDCAGIAIVPDVIRAGFVVGGRHGSGVVLVRGKDGAWSDPAFITMIGGSVGWQVGVQSADVILVFRTPRSLDQVGGGKFTLGGDIGVTAGPIGRTAEASTDAELKAEILSYSRSRGLYVGLSLQGSSISEDRKANQAFYGAEITPKDIFAGKGRPVSEDAKKLKAALTALVK